ncbi:MAG: hypothetical protein ABH864_06955 [archaeon]
MGSDEMVTVGLDEAGMVTYSPKPLRKRMSRFTRVFLGVLASGAVYLSTSFPVARLFSGEDAPDSQLPLFELGIDPPRFTVYRDGKYVDTYWERGKLRSAEGSMDGLERIPMMGGPSPLVEAIDEISRTYGF